jgi:hypothetical protein
MDDAANYIDPFASLRMTTLIYASNLQATTLD